MLRKFTAVAGCLVFSGCIERVPEESFEVLPKGGFPRLGDVPDRPQLPSSEGRKKIENQLLLDREEARQEKQKVVEHLA